MSDSSTHNDRIFAGLLLVLAIGFGAMALAMHVPFAYDPLGPTAFPLILSGALGVMSITLMLRPAAGTGLPGGRVGAQLVGVLVVLIAYAALFTRAGYLASTVVAMIVLARIFGATWVKAIISGVVLTAASYGLFVWALGIVLPVGSWLVY
ncbi:tripartite tricarboxylate transporter TctB family protein [Salinisphaera japonica]|uniref:Tricarboxylic transport membrane protein n=1 Tax=Salinisphaera japonica YTM-1 TaxID=1209778 RepID=A0A423PRB6_9GAMM|nr:tripartite tricarboxylate transporter TctB family protein [Salinisphaera japonica]ROO28061.1 tricarboxylic transport membrane protein [Salinisphaera japonica YTM-1]